MTKIVVTRRSEGCMAFLSDHKEIWGCGSSIAAAIGDLITAHQNKFDLEIEYTWEN